MSEDQTTHVVELDPTTEADAAQPSTEPAADQISTETLTQAIDAFNNNGLDGEMRMQDVGQLSPEDLAHNNYQPVAPAEPASPQVTLTTAELRQIIASEVRAATAGAVERKPVAINGMALVRVWGSYVEALNQHVSQINNFNVEVVMPASYTMGDLRRSLPRKLAKTIPSFKRLREVKGHEIIGPALPSDAIDYIAPVNQPITSHIDAINAAEGVEADDSAPTGGAAIDTSELDPATGLPRVIND
jgi:hypothetical protein